MVGANPGYYHEDFYMEHMAEDQCRVTQLFKVLKPEHVLHAYEPKLAVLTTSPVNALA